MARTRDGSLDTRLEIRLAHDDCKELDFCCKRLYTSKGEALRKGLQLLAKSIKEGFLTVFQWKTNGLYKVDAQTAGEELERIANKGELTPQNIVDESRSEDAVLHGCFDWNDETAATSWRKQQARTLIDNLVTVEVCGEATPETTRAFVHIQGNYKPMSVVVTAKEYSDEMLEKALRELRMFQNKYSTLKQLADVFASIDRALKAS